MAADPRFDVTSIGETLLGLSVPSDEQLEIAADLRVQVAGAEGNVLGCLASLDRCCALVTAVPDNALGRRVVRSLRAAGIDAGGVLERSGGRLGTFFIEPSRPPRPTRVIYDRRDSCTALLDPQAVPWEHLLDTRMLHLTGITPALSPACLRIAAESRRRAGDAGIPVSFDVNYRAALWSPEQAHAHLLPLIQGVDLLFCSAGDAALVFGCTADAEEVARELAAVAGASAVVVSSGSAGAGLWAHGRWTSVAAPAIDVVDRLGAGDALAAGVIDGWLTGDLVDGLARGVALSAMALTQKGDLVSTTRDQLLEVITAEGGHQIRR